MAPGREVGEITTHGLALSRPRRGFESRWGHHTRLPRNLRNFRGTWTNGFVERLQGTILQEHWRVAFRRRYFTNRSALHRSLAEFMRYYNDERPHQGYRLRGRTPSTLVWGAVKA